MAGPLNGLGGQQVPFANTFQPSSKDNEQVKQQQDKQNQSNKVEARQQVTNEAKETRKISSDEVLEQRLAEALSARNSGSGEVRRGSVVDVTV